MKYEKLFALKGFSFPNDEFGWKHLLKNIFGFAGYFGRRETEEKYFVS
jgi:hypothetical protein